MFLDLSFQFDEILETLQRTFYKLSACVILYVFLFGF